MAQQGLTNEGFEALKQTGIRMGFPFDDLELAPSYRSDEEARAHAFLDSQPSSNYGRDKVPAPARVRSKAVRDALDIYVKAYEEAKAAERAVDKARDALNESIDGLNAALELVGA